MVKYIGSYTSVKLSPYFGLISIEKEGDSFFEEELFNT
jgi:hypothetical protein